MKLFGLYEVAKILGISQQALGMRVKRKTFVQPYAHLKCGPIWTEDQIADVIAQDAQRLEEARSRLNG